MGKRPEAERVAREAVARLGKIDILISNAGWNIPQPVDAIRDEDWDALLELNLTSSMVLTRALAPGMMERRPHWDRVLLARLIRLRLRMRLNPVLSVRAQRFHKAAEQL